MAPDTTTLERQILGTILRDPTLYDTAEMLRMEDIDDASCKDVWASIRTLARSAVPITTQTVAGSCFLAGPGEIAEIMKYGHVDRDRLTQAVQALIDARRYAALEKELVTQLGILRQERNWRGTVSNLMTVVTADYGGYNSKTGNSVRASIVQDIRRGTRAPLPTGITYLDRHLKGGLRPADVVGVGAFAKTGKTTLVATISGNWEEAGIPHLVFTLERKENIVEKLKEARALGINMLDLDGHVDELEKRVTQRTYATYIHSRSMTVEDIRHEILHHVRKNGVRAIMLDYWQLIAPSAKGHRADNRENELSRQIQLLQATANDADVPLIITCQLNTNGEPRESNAIKFAANLYMIMHRDQKDSGTWFEVVVTNCTEPNNIGSIVDPALIFRSDIGPYFENPS